MYSKKTVLMVIPNLNFGGAQRVFYMMSIELSKHYTVIECVFNFEHGHVFRTGNEVISLNVSGGKNLFHKIWQFILRVRALKRLKKKLQPSLCISHLEGADLVNVLSRHRERTWTWVHGSKRYDGNIEGMLGFLRHRLLIPLTYNLADKVITVSAAIKAELVKYYGVQAEKIEPFHNFFDVDLIEQKAQVPVDDQLKHLFADGSTLVFSGRLVRQKNLNNLLRWFAHFKTDVYCKLIVIGDGELRDELMDLCDALNFKTYATWRHLPLSASCDVYFLGFQENPFNLIANSTAFILPSSWEGFPMVVGEAMACKTPVICSDCPTGPREMLLQHPLDNTSLPCFGEYGVLMPLLEEKSFVQWNIAVRALLVDKSILSQYSAKSARRAADFSVKNNSHLLQHLIESGMEK